MKSLPLSRRWGALQSWRHQLTVPQFTVITGLIVIALGTLLMASSLCSQDSVGLWEALFTVTSAITVTGLSIIDVGQELTLVGQLLLLALLITGGLGLMAITTSAGVRAGPYRSAHQGGSGPHPRRVRRGGNRSHLQRHPDHGGAA
jgi:Trk-type K+ transport system membrane component